MSPTTLHHTSSELAVSVSTFKASPLAKTNLLPPSINYKEEPVGIETCLIK